MQIDKKGINFQKLFEKLPQDVQEAMYSVNTSEAIQKIANKNKLLVDKMGLLAEETGSVMLGITHPKEFIKNLSQKLGVDMETARKIAEDVNQQVFAKVRESLRKIHKLDEEKKHEEQKMKLETKDASSLKPQAQEIRPLEIKPIPGVKAPQNSVSLESNLKKMEKPPTPPKPPQIAKLSTLPPPPSPAVSGPKTSPPPNLEIKANINQAKPEKKILPEIKPEIKKEIPKEGAAEQNKIKPPEITTKVDPYREPIE